MYNSYFTNECFFYHNFDSFRSQTNPVINVTGQLGIYLRVQTNAWRFYATDKLPHSNQCFHSELSRKIVSCHSNAILQYFRKGFRDLSDWYELWTRKKPMRQKSSDSISTALENPTSQTFRRVVIPTFETFCEEHGKFQRNSFFNSFLFLVCYQSSFIVFPVTLCGVFIKPCHHSRNRLYACEKSTFPDTFNLLEERKTFFRLPAPVS